MHFAIHIDYKTIPKLAEGPIHEIWHDRVTQEDGFSLEKFESCTGIRSTCSTCSLMYLNMHKGTTSVKMIKISTLSHTHMERDKNVCLSSHAEIK